MGLGQIGREIAARAKAFGMRVVAWSRSLTHEEADLLGVAYAQTPIEVARLSDAVSINVAANADTKHLVGADFRMAVDFDLDAAPCFAQANGDKKTAIARFEQAAAIQDTLRRYADAYRNRDVAAVRKVLPTLSAQQLRGLDKDFSDYRSYHVEIANPLIAIDHETAVATGQVTRSFVTRNGVAGGHTVATTFRLRKIDGSWVIERLESR